MVSREVNSLNRTGPIPLWILPYMLTLKSPSNLYALPNHIYMTIMLKQPKKVTPTASSAKQI